MTIPNLNQNNPDPQQVLNPQNNYNPTNSDTSQSQTQQTSNSQNQAGAPDNNAAIMQEIASLRQQNQQMFQMITQGGFNNQHQQIPQRQAPQLPEVPEIDKNTFWENPGQSTRTLVETLMNRALAPINQNISAFVSQQQYASAKAQMKIMPQYNLLNRIEHIFDSVVNNAIGSGIPLTDGLLTTSYYTALGIAQQNGLFNQQQQQNNTNPPQNNAMVLGNQQNQNQQFQPQNQQQQNPNNLVTPPYLSNGSTQQQQNNNSVRFRPLDENEETLRRKSGMSIPEFLFYGAEIGEEVFKQNDPQGHARYANPSGRK